MAELQKLHCLLHSLGVHIEARWLPSAVNRHANLLSRTWNLSDTGLTEGLLKEMARAFELERVGFPLNPIGDHSVALRKQGGKNLEEVWREGGGRLWNSPPDLIPVVLQMISREGAEGLLLMPEWRGQPWWGQIKLYGGQMMTVLEYTESEGPAWKRPCGREGNRKWRTAVIRIGGRGAKKKDGSTEGEGFELRS